MFNLYYNVDSALFQYKIVFMAELLIAEFLFCHRLRAKKYYPLRCVLCAVICFAAAFAFPVLAYSAWYSSLLFFCLFVLSVCLLKGLVYDESWVTIFFCAIAAYACQHIAFEIFNFFVIITGLNGGLPVDAYGDTYVETYNAVINFIHFETYFIVYWLILLLFGRRMNRDNDMRVISIPVFALAAATVFIAVAVNMMVVYYGYEHADAFYLSVICLLIAGYCVFMLCLLFGLLSRNTVRQELSVVRNMLEQEAEQYAVLKENIDYINIKCHDLKHQIRAIGRTQSIDEDSIREISENISIYDSSLKTGNNALDVLLMEKQLVCLHKGIRLTSVADGEKLAFMTDSDVYSLFGNGLDNAIQALEKIEDEAKRVIALYVRSSEGFLSVRLINYCPFPLQFRDGLPVTTKENKDMHGFGMKSIRLLTEKYGGVFSASLEEDVFQLSLLFPLNN